LNVFLGQQQRQRLNNNMMKKSCDLHGASYNWETVPELLCL